LHENPHVTPSHVGTALAGTGQGVHDVPQLLTLLLLSHALPHAWWPLLQVKPQLVPSHVAWP
jgi:hypothetical protein